MAGIGEGDLRPRPRSGLAVRCHECPQSLAQGLAVFEHHPRAVFEMAAPDCSGPRHVRECRRGRRALGRKHRFRSFQPLKVSLRQLPKRSVGFAGER